MILSLCNIKLYFCYRLGTAVVYILEPEASGDMVLILYFFVVLYMIVRFLLECAVILSWGRDLSPVFVVEYICQGQVRVKVGVFRHDGDFRQLIPSVGVDLVQG